MTSYGFLLTIGHEAEQVEEAMNKPLPTLTENPETLQIQWRAEPHPNKRFRWQALSLLASGQASSRLILAKLLAVHRHTLQAWLQLYEEGGLSARLTSKKAPGRRPSLSPSILRKLQERLAQARGFGSYGESRQYLAQAHKGALAYSTVQAGVWYRVQAKPKAPRRSPPKKSPRTWRSASPRSVRSCKSA